MKEEDTKNKKVDDLISEKIKSDEDPKTQEDTTTDQNEAKNTEEESKVPEAPKEVDPKANTKVDDFIESKIDPNVPEEQKKPEDPVVPQQKSDVPHKKVDEEINEKLKEPENVQPPKEESKTTRKASKEDPSQEVPLVGNPTLVDDSKGGLEIKKEDFEDVPPHQPEVAQPEESKEPPHAEVPIVENPADTNKVVDDPDASVKEPQPSEEKEEVKEHPETAKDLDTQEVINEDIKQDVMDEVKHNEDEAQPSPGESLRQADEAPKVDPLFDQIQKEGTTVADKPVEDPRLQEEQGKNEEEKQTEELLKVLEEAEELKKEGTKAFNESSEKSPAQLERARDKYLKSSEKLLTRSKDFVSNEAVRELYMDAMKSALMNAAMMNLKLQDYEKSYDVLKFAKQFFSPQDDQSKLNYRLAASLNGMKRHKEALEILEPMIDSTKDALVKMEYNKAITAIKEEKKVSNSQKDTYSKMFNPDKRKEEEQKRKEEKQKKKEEEAEKETTEGDSGALFKFVASAALVAGVGYVLYKAFKK